ncbi:hypothetical protein HELRODRAFT_81736 [Helobdella robusta]|uniref:Enkurin domain-containing protein n=1 Tax=Helobdella robusta TaxID=6412 RepID=T1G4I1_HELRO|nr:hypothetical protein HELRODRAFT_81736 [Helobdella robusta]ESO01384.1 hypothetical protein HELRODRAFT_81736 [Helobdella robusta]
MSYSSCRKKIVKTCVPSNESIYNLLPKVEQEVSKLPLYKSIYSSKVLRDLKNKKHDSKTFGVAELYLKPPQEFLKRQERNARITLEDTTKKSAVAPVLRFERFKKPDKKQQSTHNYIKENVQSVLKAQPKKICQPMLVFTKKGDKFSFRDSGMDAHYSRCREFGKVPCYVQRRKKELQDARDEYDRKVSDKIGACAMKKLTPEERETLLCNLHESHKKLFDQYNKLPMVISSLTMKNFKIKLEVELSQLEKDIKLLTTHSEIYVAD